jgi:DNA mismatch repair ATPase MutS
LLVFAFFAVTVWLAIRGTVIAWLVLVPFAMFFVLVVWHDRARNAVARAQRAVAVYEWGLARIEDRWQQLGRKGERFQNANHVYAEDLDLFGEQSLFQLLSTARTRMGEDTLANWLLAPAPLASILKRQDAVRELRHQHDFREQLAICGEVIPADFDPVKLLAWAEGPPLLRGTVIRMIAPLLALISVAAIVLAFWQSIFLPAVLVIAVEYVICRHYRERIHQVINSVEGAGESLLLFSTLLKVIEGGRFESGALRELQQRISRHHIVASKAVKIFSTRVDLIESREHLLLRTFNIPLLYELQSAFAMEAWRHKHGTEVRTWLETIGENEALTSLATYSYEHPADPFPQFSEGAKAQFSGEALGHPLIPIARAVRNNVPLEASTRVLVVSGSNMSGKSTYLRTIGINAVLAMSGAPVRATSLRLTPVHVGSSLHVLDSLQTGRSGFASELDRLREIMSLIDEGTPLLFLLDELLHGTNSHDRLLGGQALLRALVARGAIGVVTTHDLAITEVPSDLQPVVCNFHFEDHIEDGHMVFDFILREGPVIRSNALKLMRSIGLDV